MFHSHDTIMWQTFSRPHMLPEPEDYDIICRMKFDTQVFIVSTTNYVLLWFLKNFQLRQLPNFYSLHVNGLDMQNPVHLLLRFCAKLLFTDENSNWLLCKSSVHWCHGLSVTSFSRDSNEATFTTILPVSVTHEPVSEPCLKNIQISHSPTTFQFMTRERTWDFIASSTYCCKKCLQSINRIFVSQHVIWVQTM